MLNRFGGNVPGVLPEGQGSRIPVGFW